MTLVCRVQEIQVLAGVANSNSPVESDPVSRTVLDGTDALVLNQNERGIANLAGLAVEEELLAVGNNASVKENALLSLQEIVAGAPDAGGNLGCSGVGHAVGDNRVGRAQLGTGQVIALDAGKANSGSLVDRTVVDSAGGVGEAVVLLQEIARVAFQAESHFDFVGAVGNAEWLAELTEFNDFISQVNRS